MNQHKTEVRPRYIRTKLQNGKTLVVWLEVNGNSNYIITKENKKIIMIEETITNREEKMVVERNIKEYSERTGYSEIWKILDNCKGYTISET